MNKCFLPLLFLVMAVLIAGGYFLRPSMPPAGVARFRFPGRGDAGVTAAPYSGNLDLPLTVSYSGPRTIFEWHTQTWVQGKANPVTCRSLENLADARQQAKFSLQDRLSEGKSYYSVSYGFRRTSMLGGTASGSGSFSESIPNKASPWIATLAPPGTVDLSEGAGVALWGIVGHRERLSLPPGASLEEWASKADWAILVWVRLDR
jgi:hypothetical protein